MNTLRETLERALKVCTSVGIEAVRWNDGLDKGAVERVCKGVGSIEQSISQALTQLEVLEEASIIGVCPDCKGDITSLGCRCRPSPPSQ